MRLQQRGQSRINLRELILEAKDIVERRDDQLRTERGPPNTIDRDQLNIHEEQQVKKNPQKEKRN
jgi:hypothetical protein